MNYKKEIGPKFFAKIKTISQPITTRLFKIKGINFTVLTVFLLLLLLVFIIAICITAPFSAPRLRAINVISHSATDKTIGDKNIGPTTPPIVPAPIRPIPILEYHHIRIFTEKNDRPNYYTSVSPMLFQSQMAILHNLGYQSISPTDYLLGKMDKKSIILTFDDGDDDAYTQVYPVLKRYNYRGVFYIITNFLGQPDYLTKAQVKEMSDGGMIIGSHTLDHLNLAAVDISLVPNQLDASKAALEKIIGKPVDDFCYPFGGTSDAVARLVQAAGYQTATTTASTNDGFHNYLQLPRIAVVPTLSSRELLKKIQSVENMGQ